jgi:hypothetical protein
VEGGQLAHGPDGHAVRVGGLRPGATVVGADMPAIASDDGHPGVAHWFEGRLCWTARADREGRRQLAEQPL